MLKHFINQNDFMYSFNTHQNFFGAAIGSHIVNAWAAAEYHNYRRLVIGGRWIMTPITSDRSWSFYFDPFWNENVSLNVCAFYSDKVAPRMWYGRGFTNFNDYRNHIIKKIYKPKIWVQQEVQSRLSLLNIPDNYIALHIRRGDKINDEGRYWSLTQYIQAIPAEATSKNIVICTNEVPQVIRQEIEEAKSNYNFILDDSEIRRFGPNSDKGWSHIAVNDHHPDHDALVLDETLTAFKNIEIMRQAQYLIGCRSSYFFILAQRLRCDQNYVSLEENIRFDEEG